MNCRSFLIVSLLVFNSFFAFSQDFNYGAMIGANAFDSEVKGDGFTGGDGYSAFGKDGWPFNIGVYGNLKLQESSGIKTNLFYKGNFRSSETNNDYRYNLYSKYISSLQLQTLYVFDVDKNYGKGFYLALGPGFDFKLNEKSIDLDRGRQKAGDFYRNFYVEGLFGFGFTFSKAVGFEILGNYGLTNQVNFEDYKSTIIGAYGSLYLNIAEIIN